MTTLSAREFNQDVSAAKRAASEGPVVVTDRGEPAFVLLAIEDYRRLVDTNSEGLLTNLAMSEEDYVEDVDFSPGEFGSRVPQF